MESTEGLARLEMLLEATLKSSNEARDTIREYEPILAALARAIGNSVGQQDAYLPRIASTLEQLHGVNLGLAGDTARIKEALNIKSAAAREEEEQKAKAAAELERRAKLAAVAAGTAKGFADKAAEAATAAAHPNGVQISGDHMTARIPLEPLRRWLNEKAAAILLPLLTAALIIALQKAGCSP